MRPSTLVRPSGFEPETCGLRVRGRGIHGVRLSPVTCGYVLVPSTELGVSRPSIAEIVGWIMGKARRRPFGLHRPDWRSADDLVLEQ